jgi:hypothetical protein
MRSHRWSVGSRLRSAGRTRLNTTGLPTAPERTRVRLNSRVCATKERLFLLALVVLGVFCILWFGYRRWYATVEFAEVPLRKLKAPRTLLDDAAPLSA